MILTFEIFGRVRNHGKKFLKLCQTSFSGIVHSYPYPPLFQVVQYERCFYDPLQTSLAAVLQTLDHPCPPQKILIVHKSKGIHWVMDSLQSLDRVHGRAKF